MRDHDQIRPLDDVPDHGFGLLGGLAHSVLAEYADRQLPAPQVHLGQNTLPGPPFPVSAHVPFDDLSEDWRECGEDLAKFLTAGAAELRSQATPDAAAFSRQVRILQRALRFDSIALAWQGRMIRPAGRGAPWSLALDAPGLRSQASGADSSRAVPATVCVAADRAGGTLVGWLPATGSHPGIKIADDVLAADDPIAALLRDVLLAQYAWTSAVFGPVP